MKMTTLQESNSILTNDVAVETGHSVTDYDPTLDMIPLEPPHIMNKYYDQNGRKIPGPEPPKCDPLQDMIGPLDSPYYINPDDIHLNYSDVPGEAQLKAIVEFDCECDGQPIVFPGTFPVNGRIFTGNYRPVFRLVCKYSPFSAKRDDHDIKPVPLYFVVDTGSPYTYVTKEAMHSLLNLKPEETLSKKYLDVFIQSNDVVIGCYLSPNNSRYSHVNVLGTNFLARNRLSLLMNYQQLTCQLTVIEMEAFFPKELY